MNLADWNGVERPTLQRIDGRYCRLELLDKGRHSDDLFASAQEDGADQRYRFLFENEPKTKKMFDQWFDQAIASQDPLFYAVIDQRTGRAEGRQALMRIDTNHGVIEVGSILWGPAIARTTVCTEALFLFAHYVFEDLNYRRFEWKCHNDNIPSKKAAERFGFKFEGVFRNHMVVKGQNRDTAWFAMTCEEWPNIRDAYLEWLAPENFDEAGKQRNHLKTGNLPKV